MRTNAATQENSPSEIVPAIRTSAPWRVAELRALSNFCLWVRFNDGTEGTVSMSGFIHSSHAGVFTVLRDEALFSCARLEYGAVTWPGEIDLAPDAMYEAIRRDGRWELS